MSLYDGERQILVQVIEGESCYGVISVEKLCEEKITFSCEECTTDRIHVVRRRFLKLILPTCFEQTSYTVRTWALDCVHCAALLVEGPLDALGISNGYLKVMENGEEVGEDTFVGVVCSRCIAEEEDEELYRRSVAWRLERTHVQALIENRERDQKISALGRRLRLRVIQVPEIRHIEIERRMCFAS